MGKLGNFAKKMGLVEEVGTPTSSYEPTVEEDSYELTYNEVDADVENISVENLIQDSYDQNELADLSRSIFKVEELSNSLPKEMVTETKKASVTSILSSFGITVDEVMEDGDKRLGVLTSVGDKLTKEATDEITSKGEEIENHKKEIARLESEITNKTEELKHINSAISEEKERVGKLMEFISGGKA